MTSRASSATTEAVRFHLLHRGLPGQHRNILTFEVDQVAARVFGQGCDEGVCGAEIKRPDHDFGARRDDVQCPPPAEGGDLGTVERREADVVGVGFGYGDSSGTFCTFSPTVTHGYDSALPVCWPGAVVTRG
ncbi:hypothetical protein ACF09C_33590 [Streptomyces sp. NPDC014870]|uniref:hypothetical protein n=1 Tax=Streptomyces sp. NPDC014870 TaxID=3364925 RepID=UPI0036FA3245